MHCSPKVRALALAVALLALAPVARHTVSASASSVVGPKAYYLALGDSLAYSYQPNGDYTHGYAENFFANLQPHGTQHEIDMGCPSETSVTFIKGGCPSTIPLKYHYTGPQFAAALSFIKRHPGQVSPVTIDIGANDLFPQVNPLTCAIISPTAFIKAFLTFDANLNTILSALHKTLNGTGDLLVMNYYFPLQNICPKLVPTVQFVNSVIGATTAKYGGLTADVFTAFGGPTTPNPNICTYTWICSKYHDIHATDTGYAVIAQAIEKAAGY